MGKSTCIALVMAALFALPSRDAFAQDTLGCIDANADAQKLERAGKLREAAAKLVACANASCPAAVRGDCATILARVESEQPALAIEVHDESGAGTTRAQVWIDGALAPDAASGRAVIVDPGAHVVRSELGGVTRESRVVAVEGVKDQRVVLDFTVPTRVTTRFTVPWLAWTFAGVSAATFGAFVYFGVEGNSIKNRLDTTCRATLSCSRTEYDDMATSYTAADAFAIAAAASLVLGVVTALVWPRAHVVVRGAGVSLHATF